VPALQADLDNVVQLQSMLKQTEDHPEALKAFLEKRKPKFKGR
jgi:hypothetical protein